MCQVCKGVFWDGWGLMRAIWLMGECLGSYILFTHMIAQRRKVMRGKGVERR